MALIVSEVDVARPPDEVFRYVTDPCRFGARQSGMVSAHIEGAKSRPRSGRCAL